MSQDLTNGTQAASTESAQSTSATSPSAAGTGVGSSLKGLSYDAQVAALTPPDAPVQRKAARDEGDAGSVHAHAAHGISGGGSALPHGDKIQSLFGGYDIGNVQAHTDAAAAQGSAAMGAEAYATGNHIAFKGAPDLHTAAHEATHVIQQQAGVSLSGGVGTAGDSYEKHADAVADAVVQGKSAEPLLAEMVGGPKGGGGAVQQKAVQRKEPEVLTKTETKVEIPVANTTPKEGTKKPASASPALAKHEADLAELLAFARVLEAAGELGAHATLATVNLKFDDLKAKLGTSEEVGRTEIPPLGKTPTTTPETKTKEAPKPAVDATKLSTEFKALCDKTKATFKQRALTALTKISTEMTKLEGDMTVLLARADAAIAFDAARRLQVEELRTAFNEFLAAEKALADLLKKPTQLAFDAFNMAENRLASRKTRQAVNTQRKVVERNLDTYDAAVAGLQTFMDDLGQRSIASKKAAVKERMKASQGGIQIVHSVNIITFGDETVLDQRKRLHGVVSDALKANAINFKGLPMDVQQLVDLVGLTPELRQTFVHWLHADGGLGTEVSADAGSALSPVTALGDEMKSAGGKKAYDALAAFVRKWGTSTPVMTDARANANVAAAIASMKTENPGLAAVTNEMLMSGSVVAFEEQTGDVKLENAKGEVSSGPLELRLEVLSTYPKLEGDLLVALSASCTALANLYNAVLSQVEAGKGVEKELYARYSAFINRVGTHAGVIKMLKSNAQSANTYAGPFLKLIALKVMSTEEVKAQAEADKKAAETPTTTPTDTTESLKLGGDNAKSADVHENDGSGVDKAKAKELAELHGTLVEGSNELKGDVEIVGYGEHMTAIFIAPSASKIAAVVGKDPTKVKYVLDRFHEENGIEFFKSPAFHKCSAKEQIDIKAALGFEETAVNPYAADLDLLQQQVVTLGKLGVMDATTIASQLNAAMTLAQTIFGKLPAASAGQLDPSIAPSGRRPLTPAMLFLNLYRFKTDQDFLSNLRNVLNESQWFTKGSTVNKAIDAKNKVLATTVKTHFGFDINHVGTSKEQKVDVAMGDDAAEKLFGKENKIERRFVTQEMIEAKKVRDGFDDKTALHIADNIEGVLVANTNTEERIAKAGADAHAGDVISYELLSGSMGGLLGVLGTSKADKQLMIALKSLTFSERDAVDAAFRARFGRTLKAALAEKGKAKETEDYMSLDANDALAQAKWKLRSDANSGSIKAVFEACATADPATRKAYLEDTALMSDLAAKIADIKELREILAGDFNLYEAIAKKRGWFGYVGNDKAGAQEELDLYVKTHMSNLKAKYPDAIDPTKPKHFEHKAAFAAENRQFFVELATNPKLEEALLKVLNKNEVEVLLSKVMAGGKDDPKAAILKIWRDKGFFSGLDRKGIINVVKGLSDDDRPVVAKDLEVRAVISQALSPEDQQLVFALLAGDKNVTVQEMFVGKWWLKVKSDEIYQHLLNMDFATHQALVADEETVLGLLDAVGPVQEGKVRKLLGLSNVGYVSNTPTKGELSDATKKNQAQIVYYKKVLKERMLLAAKAGPDAAFKAAGAIFKMKVKPSTDTATSDAIKKDDDFDKNYDTGNVGEAENLLAMTIGTEQTSVRAVLSGDGDISTALKDCFGAKSVDNITAVLDALAGRSDPSAAMLQYHLRQTGAGEEKEGVIGNVVDGAKELASSLVTNSSGIKDAIAMSSDVAFLAEFTDIGQLADLLAQYDQFNQAEQYAIDEEAAAAAKASKAEALKAIRKRRIGFASLLNQQISQAVTAPERKPIEAAFDARLIAILGAKSVSDPSKVGAAAQALFKLTGAKYSKELLTSVLSGADLEARVKVDAAMEKQQQSSTGTDLFNGKNTEAYADQMGLMGNIANTSVADKGVITSDALANIDEVNTSADAIAAKIDAKRTMIAGMAEKAALGAIGLLANAFVPGAPLWFSVLLKATKMLAGHGIKQYVHGDGNYAMGKAFVLDALSSVVSFAVSSVTDFAAITKDGKLEGETLAQHPALKFLFEKQIENVISSTTGFLSNPVQLAEAYEKGWAAFKTPLKNAASSMTDATKIETAFKDKIDELVKKTLEQAMKQGKEFLTEAILGKEEKEKKSAAELVDPSKDGKGVTRAEIETLAGAGIVEKIEASYHTAVAALGPTVLSHIPFPFGKTAEEEGEHWKEWKKWAVKGALGHLVTVLKELPQLLGDPQQYVADKKKAIAALGISIPDRDQTTFIKKFKVFKESPFVAFIIDKALGDGMAVVDAVKVAWQRYSLASDIVEADKANAGLIDDIVSPNAMAVNRAAAFVKTLEERQKSTKWETEEEKKVRLVPNYSQFQASFLELVSATQSAVGGDRAVVENAVAREIATSSNGLSDFMPTGHVAGSNGAKAAASAKTAFAAKIAKAVKTEVEEANKKKAAIKANNAI